MAQDITLMGASFSDVPSVRLPKTGGGFASFTDVTGTTAVASDVAQGKTFFLADGTEATGTASGGGGGETWNWMGRNPTLIQRWTENVALADTDFATWTPSTTAKTILDARIAGTFAANMAEYDYVLLSKTYVDVVYLDSGTVKGSLIRQATVRGLELGRNASNASAMSRTFDTNIAIAIGSRALLDYHSSATVKSSYWGTSYYGLYANAMETTVNTIFSSTSSDTPTITVRYPSLAARCSSTYYTQGRATVTNQTNTIIQTVIEAWRVDTKTRNDFALFQISMDMMGDPI